MKNLLFLAHRIPYPPNKGDKVRSYHLLRHLSGRYRVYLGAFVDDPNDWRYADDVRAICSEACLIPLDPRIARLRSASGFLTGKALTLPYYQDARLVRWVKRLMDGGQIDAVLVFSSGMAQYVADCPADLTKIIDFVDVDSDKWRQYANAKSWPMSAIFRREAKALLRYERRAAASAHASVFISEHEADLFRSLAPEVSDRIVAIANGVDTDYFSPDRAYAFPYPANARVIAFTGAMDYWANVDAVQWFAQEVFPAIRSRVPDALFYIVGARPATEVKILQQIDGVHVTGAVSDVRPFLAHAAVAVAPMRIARGVQNKVLEAMAMGCKVLVSPAALEGIDAEAGRDVWVAEGVDTTVRVLQQLLEPKEDNIKELGASARLRVCDRYQWHTQLEQFDELLGTAERWAGTRTTIALQAKVT